MKNKIVIFIILTLLSCDGKDKIGLTDSTKKWVYYNSSKKYDKNKMRFLAYLKFEKNGKCANYFFDNTQYNTYMDWSYTEKDSILEIANNKFLLLKIYEDSLIMKDLHYNRRVQLLNWNILEKKK